MSTLKRPEYHIMYYTFRDPLATSPFRMRVRSVSQLLTVEQRHSLIRGKFQPDEPLVYQAQRGRRSTDVLWGYDVSIFFFSARLIQLLYEHSISGWTTYPAELYDRKGDLLVGYRGIAVTGPECTRDRSRSQIVDKASPVPGGRAYQVYRGLYFDETQWDGSDMFRISEGGGIVVSGNVRELFKHFQICNVELTPLAEVELDVKNDKYGDTARKRSG